MKTAKLHCIVLSIIILSGTCYAQSSRAKVLQVRLAPVNLFDPVTGVIQLGVQKRMNNRIALSFDYGYKFDKLSYRNEPERKNYRYYKSKAEVKYFITAGTKSTDILSNPYLSFQAFYFPQKYRKENDLLYRDGKVYQYYYSDIRRKVMVASLILGDEEVAGHFVFDSYFGFGVRRMTIKHQPVNMVISAPPLPKEWFNYDPIDRREGVFYRLHIALGFKLGYIIGK